MFTRSFYSRYSNTPARNKDSRAIVFIDAKIPGCATIIQKVNPQARAFILGLQTNGIQSITQILMASICHKVYIVGTGSPGCLYLGSQELSFNTLIKYENELQNWFNYRTEKTISGSISASSWIDSLGVVPQISLYGCNIAAGDGGAEFIDRLSQITKAEILASRDILRHEIFCHGEGKSQS